MTQRAWKDVFGYETPAAEIMRAAAEDQVTVVEWLRKAYPEIYNEAEQQPVDFEDLSLQVRREALASLAEWIYCTIYTVDDKRHYASKTGEIADWLAEGDAAIWKYPVEYVIVLWREYDAVGH